MTAIIADEIIDTIDSPINSIEDEVNYYLKLSNFQRSQPIIEFWKSQEIKIPILSQFAIDILSIPTTNLSSERNFNFAGLTLTQNRSRLKPSSIDKLLFIRSNYDLISENIEVITDEEESLSSESDIDIESEIFDELNFKELI